VIKKPRKTRRLKPATGLWKIQPQWVVTPGKQTNQRIRIRRESREYLSFTLTMVLDVATDMSALEDRIWPLLLLHGVLTTE
jgi:hypothetical protein